MIRKHLVDSSQFHLLMINTLGWPVFHACSLTIEHSQAFVLKTKNEKNLKLLQMGSSSICQYKIVIAGLLKTNILNWFTSGCCAEKWVKDKLSRRSPTQQDGPLVLLGAPILGDHDAHLGGMPHMLVQHCLRCPGVTWVSGCHHSHKFKTTTTTKKPLPREHLWTLCF